ncbi:putative parvulin-type peptidyl-prolyl cis-trans isomerase precursor [compost metagenome]
MRTRFGFHVIQLDDVRQVSFPKLEQVRSQVQQSLVSKRVDNLLRELRGKAKIE